MSLHSAVYFPTQSDTIISVQFISFEPLNRSKNEKPQIILSRHFADDERTKKNCAIYRQRRISLASIYLWWYFARLLIVFSPFFVSHHAHNEQFISLFSVVALFSLCVCVLCAVLIVGCGIFVALNWFTVVIRVEVCKHRSSNLTRQQTRNVHFFSLILTMMC